MGSVTHRCDTCRHKATKEPQSLFDVLCWLAPPVELLDVLERWNTQKPLPAAIREYVERWERVRSDESMPEIDKPKFEQPQLLAGSEKVRYG